MASEPTRPAPPLARVVTWILQIVAATLGGVLILVITTGLWWRLTPERELEILVYDQTVADATFAEHAVLGQLLEYHRVPYNPATDYFGSLPGGSGVHGTWPGSRPDLIFLADSYGVYVDDQGKVDEMAGTRITRALTLSEVEDVARWVENGTPAYAEFALVTDPTPGHAGALLEQTFGFRSTGWTVHHMDNLADVSPSIKSLGNHPWPFEGRGIILVTNPVAGRQTPRRLVVLTEDLLTEALPTVVGGPPGSGGGRAPFAKWLTIVEPAEHAVVDAWFELPVNAVGAEALAGIGIPTRFPALIRTDRTLYFAGDGLEDETPFRLRHLRGGSSFTRLVTGDEFRFLYQVLEPSVGWLLHQVDVSEENQRSALDG